MNFNPQKLPTLLLVTESHIVRAFFDHVVEKLDDYTLITTSSRSEALDYLDKTSISCIVIDEKTANIELISLCKTIRQLHDHEQTPILVITGHLKKSVIRGLLNAGATDFLREPLDEDEVLLRMEVASNAMKTQAKMTSLTPRLSKKAQANSILESRAFLDDRAIRFVNQALNEKSSLALTLIEIDQYPQIEQMQGESSANTFINELEKRLQKFIRTHDLLYNQGHGKFALFLPKTFCKAALFIAENIQEHLEKEVFSAGNFRYIITASIGIATLDQAGDAKKSAAINLERLLKAATRCLTQSKQKKNMIITEECS